MIVINESNGSDNFAANDIIKDMVTCDEFQLEQKNVNAYTMSCCARFVFTTNNENCLRVNPDSRRYVVVEVSSALRGRTDYFRELSRAIDDPDTRLAFYRLLMARDIAAVDWINDRPVTDYLLQAIAMNLPYEHQFFKEVVLRAASDSGPGGLFGPASKFAVDTLYDDFIAWLASNRVKYETSRVRFGMRLSNLVRSEARSAGFAGLSKSRRGHGTVYLFNVQTLLRELREKRWLAPDEDLWLSDGLPPT